VEKCDPKRYICVFCVNNQYKKTNKKIVAIIIIFHYYSVFFPGLFCFSKTPPKLPLPCPIFFRSKFFWMIEKINAQMWKIKIMSINNSLEGLNASWRSLKKQKEKTQLLLDRILALKKLFSLAIYLYFEEKNDSKI